MGRLFLGFDSSTQSLSAVVIDYDQRKVVYEKSLNYDQALPSYGTCNGVLPNPDPLVKHSPPLMWAGALDLLFAAMKKDGVVLGKILAVSGGGQQHGSVYLNKKAPKILAHLNPNRPLAENLHGVFSRKTSPIWMDSSTTEGARKSARNSAASKPRPWRPAPIRLNGSPARKSANSARRCRRLTCEPRILRS